MCFHFFLNHYLVFDFAVIMKAGKEKDGEVRIRKRVYRYTVVLHKAAFCLYRVMIPY
jgi:hypothetical protein